MSNRSLVPALLAVIVCVAGLTATTRVNAQEVPTAEPVKAEPTKAKPISPAKATPTVRPLSVTVTLVTNNTIEGTLTDTTQLQMQTSFGTASIPLSEVAGVRFASANDATTTVVMLNGDSITGATDVKLITVETEWGTASINGPSIASIMFVPGLTWNSQTGLNGKRWSLSDDKARSAATGDPRDVRGSSTSPQPSRSTSRGNTLPAPSQSYQSSGQPFFPSR
ncbi:hypothetical protein [Aporhodopirellula aestuarii]|uniref:Uncharacterized protein n=1 Tax=Aporhodopirellula aestuarii TaxID=2950107 RepID=A0ABT0UD96_9BACT|nr:hypothetical protein [Aporhodopirellula aestuarii]MCM2375012.1 hypothetical protein [Aporhodopirellula aestuarii]